MMDNKDRILQKVKKCLALAKSSNANEAAVALKQAQKLMTEHNINQTDIEISAVSESQTNHHNARSRTNWDWALINMIAKTFSCDCYTTGAFKNWRMGSVASFVGVGANPELAAYTCNVLKRKLIKSRAEYLKTSLKHIVKKNKTARADKFCMGWVNSVRQQVSTLVSNQHKGALEAYMKKHHPFIQDVDGISRKPKGTSGHADYAFGQSAAENEQLYQPVHGVSNPALESK